MNLNHENQTDKSVHVTLSADNDLPFDELEPVSFLSPLPIDMPKNVYDYSELILTQSLYCYVQKLPGEELTFESMKRILTESGETRREAEEERRLQLSQLFRTAPFQDLVVKTQPKVNDCRYLKCLQFFIHTQYIWLLIQTIKFFPA